MQPFQVSATEPEITIEIEVELVEEGFFHIEVDIVDLQTKKSKLIEDAAEKITKEQKEKLLGEIKTLESHEKGISNYKISLIPSEARKNASAPCIRNILLT